MLKISEFASITHIPARLLHTYNEFELLTPRIDHETGAWFYSSSHLPRLNRIRVLHALGTPLDDIGATLQQFPELDRLRALVNARRAADGGREADQLREIEARLRAIEHERQAPYDVIVKSVAPLAVITTELTMREGQYPIDFYARAASMLQAAGLYSQITATLGIYASPSVIERPPRTIFAFQPAFALPSRRFAPVVIPHYGQLMPDELPGYPRVLTTLHAGPYNQLFRAHTALLQWAEANSLLPSGGIREIYLRRGVPRQPPLVEVQMPVIDR